MPPTPKTPFAAAALVALAACGSGPDLDAKADTSRVALWEAPDRARRIAESLLPSGPWISITCERRGSATLWRFARRVQPGDPRTLLLDAEGKVWERTHVEGEHEVVQRGPGETLLRPPREWGADAPVAPAQVAPAQGAKAQSAPAQSAPAQSAPAQGAR
jgi:hypothetical protein